MLVVTIVLHDTIYCCICTTIVRLDLCPSSPIPRRIQLCYCRKLRPLLLRLIFSLLLDTIDHGSPTLRRLTSCSQHTAQFSTPFSCFMQNARSQRARTPAGKATHVLISLHAHATARPDAHRLFRSRDRTLRSSSSSPS